MCLHEHDVFARFRYNDLKEAARDLRRTRSMELGSALSFSPEPLLLAQIVFQTLAHHN
jgi:hypothetical protein